MQPRITTLTIFCVATLLLAPSVLQAKNPYRNAFFNTYTVAQGTQLDGLPSNSGHCGVCHYDFNGGGPRNPYGLGVQVGISGGLTATQAILAIQNADSDADGFSNLVEITETAAFTNTPTFPGLSASNYTGALNVTLTDLVPYLSPAGATDTTPPSVTVSYPNGGETIPGNTTITLVYTATDNIGVTAINVYFTDDDGVTLKPLARNLPNTGSNSLFIPNLPGPTSRIVVEALDLAGNPGTDDSDAEFTVSAIPGIAPTTLRDMDLSGTQPLTGVVLDDPDATCVACHGNYDTNIEPWSNWKGSMMAQAARDPLFFACLAVAEQDAPGVGDLCLRCHTPGGWMEGRSIDTSGGMLTAKDRQGVQCDFCHRAVDYDYAPGVSPAQDVAVLAALSALPLQYANGQFINDPAPLRRGPYADALASHDFVQSPFHLSADLCGTCHDVSNPVFEQVSGADYVPNDFDAEHPDMDLRNMLPVERTFSEWSNSEYATTGVYAPQFAGDKPDGMVSTCQDCHMRDVTGKGSNQNSPNRADLALHDLTGGNTFVPDIIADFYPGEVNQAHLDAGKARATAMLQLAATLEITPQPYGATVRVTNETGHKLPSGYPEGRRIWLHVEGVTAAGAVVFESGAYDFGTGELTHDQQAKIYEIHPGLSPALAGALGLTPGKSFHFVLNDTVYSDNRIPPRGFTNAAFEAIQSPPVAHVYADGQYWDDTDYDLPTTADSIRVTLYYQTTSKEYVEFLKSENHTNSAGDDLYDAWVAQGKAPPVLMAQASAAVNVTTAVPGDGGSRPRILALAQNTPNPFAGSTRIAYELPAAGAVRVDVFDLSGRLVRTLVDGPQGPGRETVAWDGRDDAGRALAGGIYFIRLRAETGSLVKRAVLLN